MAGLHELQLAEFPLVEQLFQEEILARIHDRLGHHVFKAGLLLQIDDLFAVGDAGSHRNRTSNVFARFQASHAHPAVVGNRGVDVDGIEVRVFEQLAVIGVAFLDAERIADRIELRPVTLADRVQVGLGMPLVEGDEFSSETQTDNRNIDFSFTHGCSGSRVCDVLHKLPAQGLW